jgi:hypothetical protein
MEEEALETYLEVLKHNKILMEDALKSPETGSLILIFMNDDYIRTFR